MSIDYQATIRNDHVEWAGDPPPELRLGGAVRATIRVLDTQEMSSDRGRRMAAALESIATEGSSGLPAAPDEWQREVREDRSLPGR